MPNQSGYTQQQLADLIGITVEELSRRREQNRDEQIRTTQRAIERAAEQARSAHVTVNRNSLPTLDRSYADEATVAVYTNRYRPNVPIYNDFDSIFAYSMFLNSKYKHHHKCATCLSVFRCGQAKCERTLCKLCDLRTELSAETVPAPAPWTTGGGVRLNFNGSFGGSWTNIGTGHEVIVAYDEAAQHTVDRTATCRARMT